MRPDHPLRPRLPRGALLVHDDGGGHLDIAPPGPRHPGPQVDVLEEHEVALVEAAQLAPHGRGQGQAGPRQPADLAHGVVAALTVVGGGEGVGRPHARQGGVPGAAHQRGQRPARGVDAAVRVEQARAQAAGPGGVQARVDEDVEAVRPPHDVRVGDDDPVLAQVPRGQVRPAPVAPVRAVRHDLGAEALRRLPDEFVLGAVVGDDDPDPSPAGPPQGVEEAHELLAGVVGDGDHSHRPAPLDGPPTVLTVLTLRGGGVCRLHPTSVSDSPVGGDDDVAVRQRSRAAPRADGRRSPAESGLRGEDHPLERGVHRPTPPLDSI